MSKAIVINQTGGPEVLRWVDMTPDSRAPVKFDFAMKQLG